MKNILQYDQLCEQCNSKISLLQVVLPLICLDTKTSLSKTPTSNSFGSWCIKKIRIPIKSQKIYTAHIYYA